MQENDSLTGTAPRGELAVSTLAANGGRNLRRAVIRRVREREQILRPDGTVFVPAKDPRADLLTYRDRDGRTALVTVLVRRTHDLERARRLAEQRWAQHHLDRAVRGAEQTGRRCAGVVHPPALNEHRVGWWTTTTGGVLRPRDARDEQGRVVRWRPDPTGVHAAGPGIEFRHQPAPAARR